MLVGDYMKISGFEKIISIDAFEYLGMANEHEQCHFICSVKEKDIDGLMSLVDKDCTFEQDEFVFNGHIREISMSRDISGISFEIRAIGQTYLYDNEVHNRIFQNSEKKLSDILPKLESMSDVKHKCQTENKIEGILIQDNVSDWKFAVGIANMIGEYIFATDSPFVGSAGDEKIEISEERLIDYKYGIGIDGARMDCKMDKNLHLGDSVTYNSKEFFVYEKKYLLDKEQYYYEYCLHEKKEQQEEYRVNNNLLLVAIVKDNNDPDKKGRVQVSFANETLEDSMEDEALWIDRESYYASKSLGAIFIPSVGDSVLVKVFNGSAVILGSMRTESYNEKVQNVEDRYLLLDDEVYIEYKEGCVSLVNKDNKISLSDEKITASMADKVQIVMEAGKTYVQINKTTIEISDDVKVSTGKHLVEASCDTSITATNVNIKGKSGVNIN